MKKNNIKNTVGASPDEQDTHEHLSEVQSKSLSTRKMLHTYYLIVAADLLFVSYVFSLLPQVLYLQGVQSLINSLLALFCGLLLIGSVNAWLVERFSRKHVFVYGICFSVIPSLVLLIHPTSLCLSLSFLILGLCFGSVQNSLCHTAANDILSSENRTKGDSTLYFFTHLGLPLGLLLGSIALPYGSITPIEHIFGKSLSENLIVSQPFTLMQVSVGRLVPLIICISSLLVCMEIKLPLKAPIRKKLFSWDRFWKPKTWPLFLLTLSAALIEGIFIGIIVVNTFMPTYEAAFFIFLGFLFMHVIQRIVFLQADERAEIVSGVIILIAAQMMLVAAPGGDTPNIPYFPFSYVQTALLLLGLGSALIINRLQMYFLKLCKHNSRSTLQNTHFLGWLIGLFLGFGISVLTLDTALSSPELERHTLAPFFQQFENIHVFTEHGGIGEMSSLAIFLTITFLIVYLVVIHSWFKRHNDRDFKFKGF